MAPAARPERARSHPALDTLSITAIAELMLLGMYLDSPIYFEAALVIAMLGFGSTVVLSKFVLRRDIVE
ncbi:hypothetical protein XPR_3636 [Xanthomonas arboricola pv. pruni MAFF 301420]|uniref:Monovalent cation/H+ antiporter subunit F n=1 Tax=Xanthomonas arboricola pv. pruni MAFF 301420 TaxID=1418095 RepID=W4SKG7_9XANT|nr:hypothetical protein XPR_3636 [Xanthomonas arboricola pv. pruni MAFF 301420]GAE62563.1 hypothetical protein XPN_4469 [Xanthomonas arboricola pv. pruni MAFF 301427]